MQFRVIGTYRYKGSEGVFLEAVDLPLTEPARFTACDAAMLPAEAINTRTVVGRVFTLPLTPDDLCTRVEHALG